jgi:hypothetical protein
MNGIKLYLSRYIMKKRYIYLVLAALLFAGCDANYYYDDTPPSPPKNIYVLNGDERVDLEWDRNRESDIAGYNVYYSYSYDGKYTLIGSTEDTYFIDYDAANGDIYYYAVAAYDFNGNESELSYDVIYAAPRPEGFNQSVFDYFRYPDNAGYSFRKYLVVPFDSDYADFFFENYNGEFWLDVWDDTDIQDMGPTNDIWDIAFAPTTGWSEYKDAPALIGHTYVIWTWDNHFAKIRIKSLTRDRVVFDWAYQMIEGERMLKGAKTGEFRGTLKRETRR